MTDRCALWLLETASLRWIEEVNVLIKEGKGVLKGGFRIVFLQSATNGGKREIFDDVQTVAIIETSINQAI
jgi:hypothetical protein